jgi:hypothetical protein
VKRGEIARRTPLTNKKPMNRGAGFKASEPKPAAGPKKKACRVCRTKFTGPPLQIVCGLDCAIVHGQAVTAKQKAKEQRERRTAAKEERRKDGERREHLKTYHDLVREAQTAFNAYVRFRDRDQPCICCGKRYEDKSLTAGNVHAGHYRSTGSAPHLRFNEDNVHLQNAQCNLYGAGRAADYRIGLIARIGLERVEVLEANNTPAKWTHDELREIRATYKAKLAALKKGAAACES